MALTTCYECEGKISDQAEACPNCGAPQHTIENNVPKKSTAHELMRIVAGWFLALATPMLRIYSSTMTATLAFDLPNMVCYSATDVSGQRLIAKHLQLWCCPTLGQCVAPNMRYNLEWSRASCWPAPRVRISPMHLRALVRLVWLVFLPADLHLVSRPPIFAVRALLLGQTGSGHECQSSPSAVWRYARHRKNGI